MLVPGGTLYVFFIIGLGVNLVINEQEINPTLAWIIALVVSYILGLINQTLSSILWSKFRNNPNMIKCAIHNTEKKISIYNSQFTFVFPITFVAIFLLFTYFYTEQCMKKIENGEFFSLVLLIILTLLLVNIRNDKNSKIIDKYYHMYYYVATHKYRNDISILEGQVAFLQSMLIPLYCLLLLPNSSYRFAISNENVCIIKILLFFLIIFSIPVIFFRQMKIYQCVNEDYEYLKRCKSEETKE